jgi:ribosome recycling factor
MEVRETLVKSAKAVCEEAKIGIRRVRQRGMNDVRKQKKAISQDDARMVENYVSYELYLQSYVFYLIKVIS